MLELNKFALLFISNRWMLGWIKFRRIIFGRLAKNWNDEKWQWKTHVWWKIKAGEENTFCVTRLCCKIEWGGQIFNLPYLRDGRVSGGNEGSLESFHLIRRLVRFWTSVSSSLLCDISFILSIHRYRYESRFQQFHQIKKYYQKRRRN